MKKKRKKKKRNNGRKERTERTNKRASEKKRKKNASERMNERSIERTNERKKERIRERKEGRSIYLYLSSNISLSLDPTLALYKIFTPISRANTFSEQIKWLRSTLLHVFKTRTPNISY